MESNYVRRKFSKFFTKQDEIAFEARIPSREQLIEKFSALDEMGIYLHIPFCNQICPYCPYNKELFGTETCHEYKKAIMKEINHYSEMVGKKPITSFYIGGGTPTSMIGYGLEEIISHVYRRFNMQCQVHMESHPNHLTSENLDILENIGVKYLSIGVEALQDRHLKTIERPYTVNQVKRKVEGAVNKNFECVNIDYIFDLPNQTPDEVEDAANQMVGLGVDQVATYPLFRFPYTRFAKKSKNGHALGTMIRRRRLLKILESIFYETGFQRSSVWAFTKKGVDKYCSVTVPQYLGLGASGGTYLYDIFYVNTFSVKAYIHALKSKAFPIALSIELTKEMQMSGWLYWRLYETRFNKSDFLKRFGKSFDSKYGWQIGLLSYLGFLKNGSDQIHLTDKGTYWIHAFEDFFSIDYINKLWGTSKTNPWPEKVIL